MLWFGKLEQDGSELIAEAIWKFEAIVEKLDLGVKLIEDEIEANEERITDLQRQNEDLDRDVSRGIHVAEKLRQLIA